MLVKNGSSDITTYWVLRDSTNHAPDTGIDVTDIDLYYVEERAAISIKADATALAAADSAHADNKAFHVGNGLYRIDWPDEAFNGGVGKKVILIVVCASVDTTFLECELSAPVDTVSVSGTAQTAGDIYSDTTIITSDTTKVESQSLVVLSTVSDILSDTTIIASDLVLALSDTSDILSATTKVYSDTTILTSDSTKIESQSLVILSAVSDIYSDTTIIASDLLLVYSDTTIVTSDTAAIETVTAKVDTMIEVI